VYPGNDQPQQNWGYPQQQPAYQGFGLYQQPGQPGGEPPRKRGNLVVVLSIIALVVIVGAVVTIVLLNRGGGEPAAQNDNPPANTSDSKPPSSTSAPRSSSKASDGLAPRNEGWTVIKNDKAKLIYEVPPAWTPLPTGSLKSKTLPDVTLSSPASIGDYQCEGNGYSRGGLGGGTIAKSSPGEAATTIAKAFGAEFYSSGTAKVETSSPKQGTAKSADGKPVPTVQVDATITTTGNTCLATTGKVSVLVLDAGADTYQFFVVNGDIAGGPATPPPPTEADLQKIVESARGSA
jgi:hypothetical protein